MALPFFSKTKTTNQTPKPSPTPPLSHFAVQKAAEKLAKGSVSIKDVIAPSLIEVDFDHLKINQNYYKTLFVSSYPRFVSANWLYPLISYDHSLFISMFIYPTENKVILEDLKRKIAEMEATIQTDIKRGKVVDPSVQVALDDALSLQAQLAKGAERFYQFSLYITIPAESLEELNQVAKEVESTLGSLLIISKHATLQMEDGFKSTIPFGVDRLDVARNMDTTSLATTFPFTTASLTANKGILYGINEHDGSLVIFDRFSLENANSVVFGKSVARWEDVLIRENGQIKLEKIGPFIEKQIERHGLTYRDEELEGVQNPNVEVFTYNNSLKGEWSKVTVAARKPFSKREKLYKITTKSGRAITVTADHSLIVLRKGKVSSARGRDVKVGEPIPLPRKIEESESAILQIFPKEYVASWPDFLPTSLSLNDTFLNLLGLTTSKGFINPTSLMIYNTNPQVLKTIYLQAKKIGAKTKSILDYRSGLIDGYKIEPSSIATLFTALGAGGRSGEKRVPPLLFSLSNNQIAAYLRAYFEGDGTVSKIKPEVSCTSKSKELISDIAYLLFRFGIVGRIRKKFKRATNSTHLGDTYHELVVSGKENIKAFADYIGFLTEEKSKKLEFLLNTNAIANTNVDVIPTLGPIFQKIHAQLYRGDDVKSPINLSPLKRSIFTPSREELKNIITAIENRISELYLLKEKVDLLAHLPNLDLLIQRGTKNKHLNRLLWQELGHSWQLMKKKAVVPKTTTVLRAFKTITGETITLPDVKQTLYEVFQETGVSLLNYNKSLWTTIVLGSRKPGDTAYPTLYEAIKSLKKRYRSLQLTLRHAKKQLENLKQLANSDLFWDPIVKIEKIKHKEHFVYDLTVDNQVFLSGHGGLFVHNSGGGKSFLVKLETLRSLMFGTEVFVIDPEGEYTNLARALNGEMITFSYNSPVKINPFDLSGIAEEGENELGAKILSLHALMRVVMGQLSPPEDALLDRALVLTYKQKGITPDPETQKNEPPLMEDLYKALLGMEEEDAKGLADRLEKFVKGSLAGVFNQKSNLNIKSPFAIFNIKELEAELRPIAMFIILDFIWTRIKKDLKKRLLIVDEAWYLMKNADSANFLYGIAKRARKYYLGVTTITQDVEDFLSTDHGKAIITNSSIQILLKQSTAAIDKLAEVFYLSSGEKHLLLSTEVGEGLFFAGSSHVAIRIIASPEEYHLVSSKPQEMVSNSPVAPPQPPPSSPIMPSP